MLRFSNAKLSMIYNLLSVGEAQMFLLDVVFDKTQFICQCQLIKMSVHFYTGSTLLPQLGGTVGYPAPPRLIRLSVHQSVCPISFVRLSDTF